MKTRPPPRPLRAVFQLAFTPAHQNLSQDLSRRNDAFDSKRRECNALMLAAGLDLDAVDWSQLDLIEVECAALAELY